MISKRVDRKRVELINRLALEQLHLFRKWEKEEDWLRFHVEEYDQWTFPTDRPNRFGATFSLTRDDVQALLLIPGYPIMLRKLFQLLCRSWGIDFWSLRKLQYLQPHQEKERSLSRMEQLSRCMVMFGLPLQYSMLRRLAFELLEAKGQNQLAVPEFFKINYFPMTQAEQAYHHGQSLQAATLIAPKEPKSQISGKSTNEKIAESTIAEDSQQSPIGKPQPSSPVKQESLKAKEYETAVRLECTRLQIQSLQFEEEHDLSIYVPYQSHKYTKTAEPLILHRRHYYIFEKDQTSEPSRSFFPCCF